MWTLTTVCHKSNEYQPASDQTFQRVSVRNRRPTMPRRPPQTMPTITIRPPQTPYQREWVPHLYQTGTRSTFPQPFYRQYYTDRPLYYQPQPQPQQPLYFQQYYHNYPQQRLYRRQVNKRRSNDYSWKKTQLQTILFIFLAHVKLAFRKFRILPACTRTKKLAN